MADNNLTKYIILWDTEYEYRIPAIHIAMERANYYACEVDGHGPESKEWQEEVEYSMEYDTELREWLFANMNWEDIEPLIVDKTRINNDYYPDMNDMNFDTEMSEIHYGSR